MRAATRGECGWEAASWRGGGDWLRCSAIDSGPRGRYANITAPPDGFLVTLDCASDPLAYRPGGRNRQAQGSRSAGKGDDLGETKWRRRPGPLRSLRFLREKQTAKPKRIVSREGFEVFWCLVFVGLAWGEADGRTVPRNRSSPHQAPLPANSPIGLKVFPSLPDSFPCRSGCLSPASRHSPATLTR